MTKSTTPARRVASADDGIGRPVIEKVIGAATRELAHVILAQAVLLRAVVSARYLDKREGEPLL